MNATWNFHCSQHALYKEYFLIVELFALFVSSEISV